MNGPLNVETYQLILQGLVADPLGYAEHTLGTTVLNFSIQNKRCS
jgi:hypothetical protein